MKLRRFECAGTQRAVQRGCPRERIWVRCRVWGWDELDELDEHDFLFLLNLRIYFFIYFPIFLQQNCWVQPTPREFFPPSKSSPRWWWRSSWRQADSSDDPCRFLPDVFFLVSPTCRIAKLKERVNELKQKEDLNRGIFWGMILMENFWKFTLSQQKCLIIPIPAAISALFFKWDLENYSSHEIDPFLNTFLSKGSFCEKNTPSLPGWTEPR